MGSKDYEGVMPNGAAGAKGTPSAGNIQGALHLSGYLGNDAPKKKRKLRKAEDELKPDKGKKKMSFERASNAHHNIRTTSKQQGDQEAGKLPFAPNFMAAKALRKLQLKRLAKAWETSRKPPSFKSPGFKSPKVGWKQSDPKPKGWRDPEADKRGWGMKKAWTDEARRAAEQARKMAGHHAGAAEYHMGHLGRDDTSLAAATQHEAMAQTHQEVSHRYNLAAQHAQGGNMGAAHNVLSHANKFGVMANIASSIMGHKGSQIHLAGGAIRGAGKTGLLGAGGYAAYEGAKALGGYLHSKWSGSSEESS
jgi:hypothetical protein